MPRIASMASRRNQPELHDAIAERFGDLSPPCGEAVVLQRDLRAAKTTVEPAHGRIETGAAQASAEVVAHLGWSGAAQVLRIERTREIKGKAMTENAHYVKSLVPAEADAYRLLALAPTGNREQAALTARSVYERGSLPP